MRNYKNILVYIAVFGMEFCWFYAILNAANKAVAEVLWIPLLLITLPVSFGFSRFLRYLKWPKPALTAVSWTLWPIVMLLIIKAQLFPGISWGDMFWLTAIPRALAGIFVHFDPALLILISTAILWWMGRRLAYLRPDFSAALTETQFGLIILVIVFFCAYELKLDQSSSVPIALIFFSLALPGIAISHSQNNWLESGNKGSWSGLLLLCIVLILVSGFLISLIFTPDLIQLFIKALKWIWEIINRFMQFIANLLPQPSPSTLPPAPSAPAATPDETPVFTLPEWLRPGLTLVWEIIILGFLTFALWRLASQIFAWMGRRVRDGGVQVESLKGAFRLDLLNFIKKLISKIFRIKFGANKKAVLRSLPPEITSVRSLYRELLQWAARNGCPRQKSQTPEEYRNHLAGVLSENMDNLSYLTRQYVSTRYGEAIPSEAELAEIKEKWHNLKKNGFKKPLSH